MGLAKDYAGAETGTGEARARQILADHGSNGQQLARHAQAAPAFQHDEHLFLRRVDVIGTRAHAGREDVQAGAALVGRRAGEAPPQSVS